MNRYNKLLWFMLFIFLLLIIVLWLRNDNIDTFTIQSVTFLSDKETAEFLRTDRDSYIRNMSKADLYARKVKTPSEYIQKAVNGTSSFTEDDKNKLIKCTQLADQYLHERSRKTNSKDIYDMYNVYALCTKIPWKFALCSPVYEEGLPHTREDVIFLSSNIINKLDDTRQIIDTLIHEKVHIFQRANSGPMQHQIIPAMGYIVSRESDVLMPTRRSNPDINNKIYYDPVTDKTIIYQYTSGQPSGINDIKASFYIEHPYEKMAYHIANECTKHMYQAIP